MHSAQSTSKDWGSKISPDGRDDVGVYYQLHNIQKPINYAGLSFKHANVLCSINRHMHTRRRHTIDDRAPGYHLATLLGTNEGIQALAQFVRGRVKHSRTPRTHETDPTCYTPTRGYNRRYGHPSYISGHHPSKSIRSFAENNGRT